MNSNLTLQIDQIRTPLQQARQFWRLRLALMTGLSAAWASLLLYWLRTDIANWSLSLILAFPICILMAGGIWSFFYQPDLAQMARRADATFHLSERLSTALQLKTDLNERDHPLHHALIKDAALHAKFVDPLILEPVVNRTLIALIAGLMASVIVTSKLTPMAPERTTLQTDSSTAQTLNADLLAENLISIASELSVDAEKRENSYLSAIANAVKELADKKDPDQIANVSSNLQDLLEHARLAYGDAQPAWLRNSQAMDLRSDLNLTRLAQLIEDLKPVPMQNGGGGEELVPELFTEHDAARQAAYTPMVVGEFRGNEDKSELKMSGQNVGPEGNEAQTTGQAKASAANSGNAMTLGDRGTKEPITMDGAAAILAGGANQSGAGNSRLAGKGTQELFDPNAKSESSLEANDTMLLPLGTYQAGRRIRLQTMPSTKGNDANPSDGIQNAQNNKDQSTGMTRDRPSLLDEAMFSRAFKHNEGGLVP
jgi:hypothetical protein